MRKNIFSQKRVIFFEKSLLFAALMADSTWAFQHEMPSPTPSAVSFLPAPCAGAQPITRWNRLDEIQRVKLDDSDLLTNVTGFPTGFQNALLMPITVDITAGAAPNSGSGNFNFRQANRWGLTGFNNGRDEGNSSGNQFCFTFSEPLLVELNSEEHSHFQNNEHVWVTAFDNAALPVALSGSLEGSVSGGALLTGNGTPQLHFDAKSKRAAGMWWTASSDGAAVKTVCVEYYRSSPGQGKYGREPFTLSICGATRYLFDDPFAMSVAPPATPLINDNLSFAKGFVKIQMEGIELNPLAATMTTLTSQRSLSWWGWLSSILLLILSITLSVRILGWGPRLSMNVALATQVVALTMAR